MTRSLLFLFGFVLVGASSAIAAEENPGLRCTFEEKSGKSQGEKTSVQVYFLDGMALVGMRFDGAEPDRYFARTRKGSELVQFATRENFKSPLKLRTVESSRFMIETLMCGNRYGWFRDGQVLELTCLAPSKPCGSGLSIPMPSTSAGTS